MRYCLTLLLLVAGAGAGRAADKMARERLDDSVDRGLRYLAPHLRQLTQSAGGKHRIEHELSERSGGQLAFKHGMGAPPEHRHHARED